MFDLEKVLQTANSLPLWIFASLVVGIVIFQGIIFIRLASKTSQSVGMTSTEVKSAIRAGAISSLGPSLAIIVVAISMISLIGSPTTLMRISIIGNAAIETVGASIGSKAAGVDLGSSDYTLQAFTNAVWVMCLGGMGWLLFVALFTKSLGKIQKKAEANPKNVTMLSTVSVAAMIGAFSYLGGGEMVKGLSHFIVFIVAFITMPLIIWIGDKSQLRWLKEWSLGLVIIVGMIAGYVIS
ncbi:DUF5058 family protein [Bacillus sp. HNG]|uniref:DUF5058 family protein n=1 Tax=Bacillus sp. HNG TaxID=2293325 RepID=UPI000E2EE8F4|nr:DUF5058 family protein [Bacillus sp. HNG]RFB18117.1 DUF5058 family protein [Bacillus sp. HNG]